MTTAKRILCAMFIAVIAIGFSPCAGAQFASPSPSISADKPRIIVEECTVEGGGLISGTVCEVSVTLRNTSPSTSVSSVLVTGRWQSDNPPPVAFEMTNQAYISGIGPMQTQNVVFSLETKSVNIWALDSVPLYLDIVYSFDKSLDNSNTVLLQLPIGNEQSGQPVPSEDNSPPFVGYLDGFPLLEPLQDYMQYIFIGGSVLFALAAGILILLRLRRQ